MKAYLVFGGGGPIVVLTSHASLDEPALTQKLGAKGLEKFLAYEIPVDLARQRYGAHFDVVIRDLHETDDLRVLDFDGRRAFRTFAFTELGEPVMHERTALHV
jgi:hypothetical protein